jgi:hypothetical protein
MIVARIALFPVIVFGQILVWTQPAAAATGALQPAANLVPVDAVVSANGGAVPGLTASDFELYEDGKPLRIEATALQRNRSTIFLVDACANVDVWRADGVPVHNARGSSPVWGVPYLRTEQAVAGFLGDWIASSDLKEDRIAVLSTNEGSGALEEPGRDRDAMRQSLAGVSLPGRLQGFCLATNGPEQAIQIALSHKFPKAPDVAPPGAGYYSRGFRMDSSYAYNSMSQAIDALSEIPGHKDLIVFWTGSLPRGGSDRVDSVIQELTSRANRAGVSIHILSLAEAPHQYDLPAFAPGRKELTPGFTGYWLNTTNAEIYGKETAMMRTLAHLATDTGGLFSELPDPGEGKRDLEYNAGHRLGAPYDHFGVLRKYEDDFIRRVQDSSVYLISYLPATPSGASHHVTLKIRRPGVTARLRSGYYDASVGKIPLSAAPESELAAALEKPLRGAAIRLRAMPFDRADRGPKDLRPVIDLVLSMDARDLTWTTQQDGTRRARVEAMAAWYGDDLRPAGTATHNCTIAADAAGAPAQCVIELDPGAAGGFFVRAAVRDAASGRMGTAYAFAPVPEFNRNGYVTMSMPILRSASGSGGLNVDPEFVPGQEVAYDMTAYSVRLDKKTRDPKLTLRISLANATTFEPVFLGDAEIQKTKASGSLVPLKGRFRLPPDLPPGDYVVQFLLADTLAGREKNNLFLSNSRLAGFRVVAPHRAASQN